MDNMTPETIFNELSKSVIGQDEYLRVLSNAAWIHNLRYQRCKRTGNFMSKPKQNILCIGPSGTGKTLAVEQLGKLLDLPVVIENASTLRGEGWKGRSVSSIIARCIDSASNKDVTDATHSIVCLDEIDKVFKSGIEESSFLPTDNLLTFLAGSIVNYEGNNRTCMMNTSNLLVICLGAFEGLEDIIKERLSGRACIGFSSVKPKELPQENLLQYLTEEDLHAYGISNEFLGRISLITHTNPLTSRDYTRILSQSDVSPVYQYDALLYDTIGMHVDITEEAVAYMAKKAQDAKEGARLLARTVTEILQPDLYKAAGDDHVDSLVIDCADGRLCVHQTNVGRDDLWDDDRYNPEGQGNILASVPLAYMHEQSKIMEYAKKIKDASPYNVVLSGNQTMATVYVLAAAIARQLQECRETGMTMKQVDRALDALRAKTEDNDIHPLAVMSRQFIIEAQTYVPDWSGMIAHAKQILLDYCNAWIDKHYPSEL